MELKIFFDKVNEEIYENINDETSFFHHISINGTTFPDWQKSSIVIIGLEEERGNLSNKGAAFAADIIRKSLYRLKNNVGKSKIVDLGNLRIGASLEDTLLRIKEVCEILVENGKFVILLGGTNDLAYGQYLAYEKFEKMVSIVSIDAIIDLFSESDSINSQNFLQHILTHEPNYLFHITHLASQSFLNANSVQETIEKLCFENVRLGQIRENFAEVEPLMRMADIFTFDVGAIKKSDAPGNIVKNVFGLSAEEACQLAWYAGLNDKLSSASIFEYNPEIDVESQTSFVIATMVWYLIEGFNHRKGALNFDDKHFIRYMVSIGKDSEEIIVFYKSRLSEKWWMEVPYPIDKKSKFEKVSLIPCSYSDYETALKGELPDRWILMHGKLL